MSTHKNRAPFEPGAVNARGVLGTVFGILVFLLLSMGALLVIYLPASPKAIPDVVEPPAPRVNADERVQRRALQQRQRDDLSGYRWLNKDHTLVAIPIERGMQIIAGRGADGYGPIVPSKGAQ